MNPYEPPSDESQLDRIERRFTLHQGDCLDVLKTLADCSVDAIVTDPPYGLGKEPDPVKVMAAWVSQGYFEVEGSGFMGKKWDAFVPQPIIWKEVFRVLKPGGHLLAFAGTRTQDWMAMSLRFAGFEIRDMIAWVYGSGFPKSMDISKQLDKMDASQEQEERRFRFTEWVRSTGVTAKQIDDATATKMGSHYTTHPTQPAIMTREHLEACRGLFSSVPEWVEQEADIRSVESKNFAGREVVGSHSSTSPGCNMRTGMLATEKDPVGNLTAPATEAAKQWEGWGTALKPALEPITLARKPLIGTVAANVLEHGTGGLNIDGCRVGTDGGCRIVSGSGGFNAGTVNALGGHLNSTRSPLVADLGRWPANLIHDGSEEVLALFPEVTCGTTKSHHHQGGKPRGIYGAMEGIETDRGYGDSGSAARFFYCAKASRDDRDEGCGALELTEAGIKNDSGRGFSESDPMAAVMRRNPHPTVKPTDLMRYLCRLITPPNGIVLDPFTGSGSTGKAAMAEGFRFIGIEREAEYIEIARARISAEAEKPRQLSLF
jgi:DNA modification methylase